jgi:cytochrome c-type biogenesis protein
VALGAGASALGQGLYSARETLTRIGGVVIVILGMHLTGIARIKWLDFEQRVHMKKMRFGLFGAFLLGFFFAFGWSPCVGPILGPILGIAATEGSVTKGMFLLTVYTLGLGIPFILTALFVNGFFRVFGKIKKHMMVIEAIAGVLVIAIGMIMVLDAFGTLQAWFDKIV